MDNQQPNYLDNHNNHGNKLFQLLQVMFNFQDNHKYNHKQDKVIIVHKDKHKFLNEINQIKK